MSTHTDRCFSRKSSGRYGHGIRLNHTNFMTAFPLAVPAVLSRQDTSLPTSNLQGETASAGFWQEPGRTCRAEELDGGADVRSADAGRGHVSRRLGDGSGHEGWR